MSTKPEAFKSLPAVTKLLVLPEVKSLIARHGKELITFSIRNTLEHFRTSISKGHPPPSTGQILDKIQSAVRLCGSRSLKKVVNATGIIIHTNLGRSPFGDNLLNDSFEILKGYNNLEFNLQSGTRGNRNDHASELLKFLTGAEDVLVVNNNAAAVMLILRAFAKGREVIVSRGELIEIGGSFRVPEIMAASDCKMIEVGTTNKTRIDDYSKAINDNTAMLFKAHKSNYVIRGFTEEAGISDLVQLAKKHKIPFLYDLGSGLLRSNSNPLFKGEPDVRHSLEQGIDLVCFSGDKLLGGPQAGIIAGKKVLIDKLKKEPMLRALRVCKVTLAMLETVCMYYFNEKALNEKNLVHKVFNRGPEDIKKTALALKKGLDKKGIKTNVVDSTGQFGGGTLPDGEIKSYAVKITNDNTNKKRSDFAENFFAGLLSQPEPVLGILKKGDIYFDVLTIFEDEVPDLVRIISEVYKTIDKSE
jgi:L-seryl-tRNA(Ser) seleniumtransferase